MTVTILDGSRVLIVACLKARITAHLCRKQEGQEGLFWTDSQGRIKPLGAKRIRAKGIT
jgi:hypothetical protein